MTARHRLHALGDRLRAAVRADLRGHVTQNVVLVLSGHLLRLGLGLVSSALLARGLGPTGMSAFAVVGTVTAIGITMADFGLSRSAVRQITADLAPNPERARRSAASFVRLKLLATLCVAVPIAILAQPIAQLLNLPPGSGRAWLIVASCGIIATSLSSIVATMLQALSHFKPLIAAQSLNIGISVALFAGLFVAGRLDVLPALLVGVVAALAAAGLALARLPAAWRVAITGRAGARGPESRELLAFSRWLWISAMLSIGATQLDLLLLNWWSTPERTGWYALALNLSFKADIVNQTIGMVLLPVASALAGRSMYVAYLRRSLRRSLVVGVFLLALLPLARPFILLVYGSGFAPSVRVFYLLMAVVVFDLLTAPMLLLAYPLGLPRFIAAADATRIVVLIAVGAVLIPAWGMYGAALSRLVSTGCGVAVLGGVIAARLTRQGRAAAGTARPPDASTAPDPARPDPM